MKNCRILVADDELESGRSYRTFVKARSDVECVESGIDAIVALSHGKFDVAFLDIRMPKGDGITTLKQIRNLWPDLKVVMITGCRQSEMIDESMDLGSWHV